MPSPSVVDENVFDISINALCARRAKQGLAFRAVFPKSSWDATAPLNETREGAFV